VKGKRKRGEGKKKWIVEIKKRGRRWKCARKGKKPEGKKKWLIAS